MFFYELSIKAMEPAFLQAKKIVQKAHNSCGPKNAWNEKSQTKFARCAEELTESIPWLGEATFKDIENFAAACNMQFCSWWWGPNVTDNAASGEVQWWGPNSGNITTSILCSEIQLAAKRNLLGEQYFSCWWWSAGEWLGTWWLSSWTIFLANALFTSWTLFWQHWQWTKLA